MENNIWYAVRNQSLAIAARNAGFDLAIYDTYSDDVKEELRKLTIKAAMKELKDAFATRCKIRLPDVKRGVYVISLGSPLAISYSNHVSEIIYIGLGNVVSRIETHFNNSLFDFMQSLSGANFDFRVCQPHLKWHTDYYKHVEYMMLSYFKSVHGYLPLLNSNAGSDRQIETDDEWWKTPLKKTGKKPRWGLTALKDSGFTKLLD